MADLSHIDARAFEALRRAKADPDAAAKALEIAAEYLRAREPLPHDLADWLADAFESAAAKPPENRADMLAMELLLRSLNRRPARADWIDVGQFVDDHPAESERQRLLAACTAFNISETTARRLLKQWRDYEEPAP